MYGVCFFLYRLCDETDGKQARNTGNSSALGLLFDHGCDSFAIGFVALNGCKCLQMGNSLTSLVFVGVLLGGFYLGTLEQYYTGGCFLGPGNAVSDFSPILSSFFLILGLTGNDILLYEIMGSWRINDIIAVVGIAFLSTLIITNAHTIAANDNAPMFTSKKGAKLGEKFVPTAFAVQIVGYVGPWAALTYLAVLLGHPCFGSSKVDQGLKSSNGDNLVLLIMILQCQLLQHLSCCIMISHACRDKFNPFS